MNRRCCSYYRTALFLLTVVCLVKPAGATQFRVTVLDGVIGSPCGINDAGQVISMHWEPGGQISSSYLWTGGTNEYLGSVALSINSQGQVAGYDRDGSYVDRAWVHGLDWQQPFSEGTEAWGINESGQVVGWMRVGTYGHAYRYDNGTCTDLTPSWDGTSVAVAINDHGQVVIYRQRQLMGLSYLWDNGAMYPLMQGVATHINNTGQVLGFHDGAPAIWRNLFLKMLAVPAGYTVYSTRGLNDRGQAIANCTQPDFTGGALLWENGVATDLDQLLIPDTGWSITEVGGINELGQIVGMGTRDGSQSPVLLTPVPEPSCLAGLMVGVAGLWALRRRSS